MASKNERVVNYLNSLIETCYDGQEGYREAADKAESSEVKNFCQQQSTERARFAGELQQEVRSLGGDVAKSGSTAGLIHRTWLGLKENLGAGDVAILSSCESGEDSALNEYRETLAEDLPADVKMIIERQFHSVKAVHDKVKHMRDAFKQARN